MEAFLTALDMVLDINVVAVVAASAAFGLLVGAIPGLTATMAIALLIPVTFFMEPVAAMAAIVTTAGMAIFAGDLPGALLRMPGTPASAAYTDDAHGLTRKGRAGLALGAGLVCSAIGGILGSVILTVSSPLLAEFALQFSPYEYFWLAALGLSCAAFLSSGPPVKSIMSLLAGLFLGSIGIDILGYPRFTFGHVELMGGVSLIPALIGMFAVSEVLRYATSFGRTDVEEAPKPVGSLFAGLGGELSKYRMGVVRSSLLGTVIGALPGAGADIAAWISYAISKRLSKEPERFGTGHVEGIVSASSANNAAVSGAWVPALVFGIPGDTITAIALGVLLIKGLTPGPTVFIQNPELVNAVFITFFLANLLLLPLGYLAIRSATYILNVPRNVLMPVILVFSIVGAFAMNNSVFGVTIMLVLGILGFLMEENGFPVAPAILGMVLGPILEFNFLNAMISSRGDLLSLFSRPIAGTLGVLTLAIWAAALVLPALRKKRTGSRSF